MSDQLLTVLKLCLLALLYLFFFRVIRAVWAEVSAPAAVAAPVRPPAPVQAVSNPQPSPAPQPPPAPRQAPVGQLVIVEPAEQRGTSFPIGGRSDIGRAATCAITIADSFSSQQHAQVSAVSGQYVVEDLGSTNGTYLNRERVAGPTAMNRGDRIQIGNTVLELL